MAHAYTPGLTVSRGVRLRRRRLLPMEGEVLVEEGDYVDAEQVVATAELPGDIHPINVVGRLGIRPADIEEYMLKEEGDEVEAEETIAETHPWISFLKTTCRAPVEGTIDNISDVTGQVMLREPPRHIDLAAYLRGQVTEVLPGEGVVVESNGALLQGIFGIGGECYGTLRVAADGPGDLLEPGDLGEEYEDCIVVCGSLVDAELVQAAREVGVSALVAGGIRAADLREIVGRDIGVAVTGTEDVGLSVILTEGFSRLPIAEGTFSLLRELEGREASANGTTQIRAGVQRPEVVVPGRTDEERHEEPGAGAHGLREGDRVRVIRAPYFGVTGTVSNLVEEPRRIESEAEVRVLELETSDGRTLTVPRTNTEVIG
ncbi:MAG: hypothetical protein V5A84_02275 [Planctomycetota bacterium]